MSSDVIIRNFKQSQMQKLVEQRNRGISAESLGDMFGRNEYTVLRYLRIYDIYGINAFAKG
jgi:hypothetical protein